MKKGVVLLISLFFITAISILVLKNLNDTDIFLQKQNYKLHNTQVLVTIKNMQKEVSSLLSRNIDKINKEIEDEPITLPLIVENINITAKLDKYERIDINDINKKDSKTVEELFSNHNIFDYSEFVDIYKEKVKINNKKINSNKQLDDIISYYIIRVGNHEIEKIRGELGFISNENIYELNIKINYLGSTSKANYLLTNKGEVKYFDVNFN